MSTSPNDPVQLLANLFENGQAMMQPFIAAGAAAAAAPAADAAGNPYAHLAAASLDFAEMQQNYLRQMSALWLGMATAAGRTSRCSTTTTATSDRSFRSASTAPSAT